MGYEIHVTRAPDHYYENKGHEITAAEWLALVDADPELKLAGYNGPYFALWSGQSRNSEPWFCWYEGNVDTKSPDPPTLAKALRIAESLGARVQGDDGEIYGPDGKIFQDGVLQTREGMDWRTW